MKETSIRHSFDGRYSRFTILHSSPSDSKNCKIWENVSLQEDVQEEGFLEAKLGDKVTVLEENQGEDKAGLFCSFSFLRGSSPFFFLNLDIDESLHSCFFF